MRPIPTWKRLVVATWLWLTAGAAGANPRVNTQIFRPASHRGDLFTTQTSATSPAQLRWSFATTTTYGRNSLVFVRESTERTESHPVIEDQVSLDVTASLGIMDWLDIGVAMPFFFLNQGQTEGFVGVEKVPSQALGDLRLSTKWTFYGREERANGFGIALDVAGSFPTGTSSALVSDGWSLHPSLIADVRHGPFLLALNVGYQLREEVKLAYLEVPAHSLTFRGGVSLQALPDELEVVGEVYGATADFGRNATNLEGIVGVRYRIPDLGVTFFAGGGAGIAQGYGNTQYRFFGGIGYQSPHIPDHDLDGVRDERDACPDLSEDVDGFEDDDGCPEEDNDGDGILDADDRCPLEREDRDDLDDGDGCAETDVDGDGLLDEDDHCPGDPQNRCRVLKTECALLITEAVQFEYLKYQILPVSHGLLQEVAATLQKYPEITVLAIQGHTDDTGRALDNQLLSEQRAAEVKRFLVESGGIAVDRLIASGFGEELPLTEATTDAGRAVNRRVEFIIRSPEPTAQCLRTQRKLLLQKLATEPPPPETPPPPAKRGSRR